MYTTYRRRLKEQQTLFRLSNLSPTVPQSSLYCSDQSAHKQKNPHTYADLSACFSAVHVFYTISQHIFHKKLPPNERVETAHLRVISFSILPNSGSSCVLINSVRCINRRNLYHIARLRSVNHVSISDINSYMVNTAAVCKEYKVAGL